MSSNYAYIIGVDPGTNTGVSFYDPKKECLVSVDTLQIHKALRLVEDFAKVYPVFVRFEDARTWRNFGRARKQTDAMKMGAGSIRRDSKIWEDFLTSSGIPFEAVSLGSVKTKVTSAIFKKTTGYVGKTDEHGRDSAMLCYKYKPKK